MTSETANKHSSVPYQLATWVADCAPINDPVLVNIARDAFVDITACIIGGCKDIAVQNLIGAVRDWGTGGSNLVVGSDLRFHAPWAALINGTASHVLDFDDNFIPAFTHATSVLAPALLALAEVEHKSGAELLDAYIIGLELHARIGKVVNPGHYQAGWHATSTVGTIGTAGACARLLGLDARTMAMAMSIAFSMAGGSKRQFGSMMKPTHAGLAAQHAVMAVQMARNGVTGNPDFLIGPWGFQNLYANPDPTREHTVLDGLGESFAALTDGLLVKRFPCCASAHMTLDGLLSIREDRHLRPEQIKRVVTSMPETMCRNLKFNRPENEMEARFSLHYNAARILVTGNLSLRDFREKAVKDPQIVDFLDRIEVRAIPDPENMQQIDQIPVETWVELSSGEVIKAKPSNLKGSRLNPLSSEDLERKFRDCLQFMAPHQMPDNLFEQVMSIADLEDITALTETLSQL